MTNQSKDTNKHNLTTARLFFEIDNNYKPHPSITNWDIASAVLRHLILKMDVENCGTVPLSEIIEIVSSADAEPQIDSLRLAIQTLDRSLLINSRIENGNLDYYVDPQAIEYPISKRLYPVRRYWKPTIAFDYSTTSDCVVFYENAFASLNVSFAAKAVYALLLSEPDTGEHNLADWLTSQANDCSTTQAKAIIRELIANGLLESYHNDWIVHEPEGLSDFGRALKIRPNL